MTIISQADWDVKNEDPQVVPIVAELNEELLVALAETPEGEKRVIPAGSINVSSVWRGAGVLCATAGLLRYRKPLRTPRKRCITEWARLSPARMGRQ